MEATLYSNIYVPTYNIEIQGENLSPAAVISVSVDENLENPANFDFSLHEGVDPETREFTWLDNPVLDPGNTVKIYFGYSGKNHLMIHGTIKSLSTTFSSSGIPGLTVEGYDLSFPMQKRRSKIQYINKKYSDIARELAKNHNLRLDGIEDSLIPPDTIEMRENEKDYDFLKRLAGEIGFEFYVRGDTLYFKNRQNENTISRVFEFRKNFLSFTPRLSMAALLNEVVVLGWDNEAKRDIKVSVTLRDISTSEDMRLLERYVRASEGTEPKIIENRTYDSEDDARTAAKAELIRTINTFIQGNLECIGDAEVLSGMYIRIQGTGNLYTGTYYITSTNHTFGIDGYKTNLEVRRIIL